MQTNNYDYIEQQLKQYKDGARKLQISKTRLEEVIAKCALLRKNLNSENKAELKSLNEERARLKVEISNLKKVVKTLFKTVEDLIFLGIETNYTEVYENQLSRLYGFKVDVLIRRIGDDFDLETCNASKIIITKDKSQHGKILKMISFGLKERETNFVSKKALVEVCCFSKKHKAGEAVEFDLTLLGKLK